MKKLYILLVIVICLLTGCKKCISTETRVVQVQITDATYTPGYNTVISTGKTISLMYHQANYVIDVEYDGIEYSLYGYEIYQKYFDKIGSFVNATLEINKYDNGTQKYTITEIE